MEPSALSFKGPLKIMLLVLTALLAHKTLAQGNACGTGGSGSSEEDCNVPDDNGGAEIHPSQEPTGPGGPESEIPDDWQCRPARFDLLSFRLMLANADHDECAASCKAQANHLRDSLAGSAFIAPIHQISPICNFGYACVRWTSNQAKMGFPSEASSSSSNPVSKPRPPENIEQAILSSPPWFNYFFEQYEVAPDAKFWDNLLEQTEPGRDSAYNPGFYGRAVSDYFERVSEGARDVPIRNQKLSRPDTVCKCHFDVEFERVAWQNVPTCRALDGRRDTDGRLKSPQFWPGLFQIFDGFFFERDRYGLEDAPFVGWPESCNTPSRIKRCCKKHGRTFRADPDLYVTDEELISVPTQCVHMTPFELPPQFGSYTSPYFEYGGSSTLPYAERSADNQEL